MRAALALLAVLVSLSSFAAAAPNDVVLIPTGPIEVDEASGRGSIVAAFASGTPALRIACDDLRVTRFEWRAVRFAEAEVVVRNDSASYSLHDVEITVAGEATALWLGVYPPRGEGSLSREGRVSLEAQSAATIGNARSTPEAAPAHDRPSFGWREARTSLIVGTLDATIEGALTIKLAGALLQVHARENETPLDTTDAGAAPGERARRWAVLECAGTGIVSGLGVGEALLSSWSGSELRSLAVPVASGEIVRGGTRERLADPRFVASGGGDLEMTILDEPAPKLALRFADEARFGVADAQLAPPPFAPSWWMAAVAIGVVMGAGGATLALRRRRRPEPMTLDEIGELTDQAASAGRFELALSWIDRALELQPDHPSLLLDRGYFLGELGRVDDAIAAYRVACQAGRDGEAEILLARLLCSFAPVSEEALRCVEAALRKDPLLLLDVEEDPALEWTLGRAAIRETVDAARRAIHT